MDILLIGSRGREHALALELKKDPRVDNIFCIPGNGGLAGIATCINKSVTDFDGILEFLDDNPNIRLTVVSPDESLLGGLVDILNEKGHRAFGCCSKGALMECSKEFCHNLCEKYGIPSSKHKMFDDYLKAKKYIKTQKYPLVIKTEGRTAGKGIIFARNQMEAENNLYDVMIAELFGDAGKKVDIEEFVQGDKVIVLTLTDGKSIYPLRAVNNYKRVYEGDVGMSTAGMGASMPAVLYTPEVEREAYEKIFVPTLEALKQEGIDYKGVLGFSLILTENGIKAVDFICRFCDVESQILFSQIQTPLLDIFEAVIDGDLGRIGKIEMSDKCGVCVVATSGGYPLEYSKFNKLTIGSIDEDVSVYHAGTKLIDGELKTSGGRVISVACWGDNMEDCVKKAYKNIEKISFEGMHYRKDIAGRNN